MAVGILAACGETNSRDDQEERISDWARSLVSPRQVQEANLNDVPVALEEGPTGMKFVLIPGGSFLMGSNGVVGEDDERPQHAVVLSPYYISIHEVTNGQYRRFSPDHDSGRRSSPKRGNPATFPLNEEDQPVVNVSYEDASRFVAWLSRARDALYSLPTEAQWEYACRAGTTTDYNVGAELTAAQANYRETVGGARAVGHYAPNPWGLFDMHGNAMEYCRDSYVHGLYRRRTKPGMDPPVDPEVPLMVDSSFIVVRGGSWGDSSSVARSASRVWHLRDSSSPYVGFRVVRALAPRQAR